MNSVGKGDSTCLEYLYKEYVRLSGTYEASIKSSFDDIKLLGAIAVLLAWKPIAESKLIGSEGSSELLLLIGFVAILVIVAILAVRELIKQSLVNYYLQQVLYLEREIRHQLGQESKHTFAVVENWKHRGEREHGKVMFWFQVLFGVVILAFPTAVLAIREPRWYAAVYAGVGVLVLVIYMFATRALFSAHRIQPNRYMVCVLPTIFSDHFLFHHTESLSHKGLTRHYDNETPVPLPWGRGG